MRINHECYVGGSSRLDIMEFEELQFRLREVGVSVRDGIFDRWATTKIIEAYLTNYEF